MKPYYDKDGITIHRGDCLEIMPTLDENSVDSIATDPPYGLSFMGKEWDHGIPGEPFWIEALRVAKPGAHLLAFGGTRTYHRLACAIEDAGWELRDCIMWVYGSGFPKSLDVSKAIDKARTEDEPRIREICRFIRSGMDAAGLKSRSLTHLFGDCDPRLIDHWAARDTDSQPSLPTREQFEKIKAALDLGNDVDRLFTQLDARKGERSDDWKAAEIVGAYAGDPGGLGGKRFTRNDNLKRAPATDEAKKWDGWGTALKPSYEPIIVARKPLEGTVAANTLKWGTGGINIDGCRVALNGDYKCGANGRPSQTGLGDNYDESKANQHSETGRFPANLIHDGSKEVTGLFPETTSGRLKPSHIDRGKQRGRLGAYKGREITAEFGGDSGSAARFFYAAKADSAERRKSNHPTVKPLDLMRYLVRLVTPVGGITLDPFLGSGTTIEAARAESCKAIGIELSGEYCEDAIARLTQGVLF